jgi:hypothetical protein
MPIRRLLTQTTASPIAWEKVHTEIAHPSPGKQEKGLCSAWLDS